MAAAELNLLAIDTVTEVCSVALSLEGKITSRLEIAPNGHSRLVLGMVESLLRESGLELRQLHALAVDVGPGSFTGVRIGIGVAQGLAYGAGLAVVPVGSLEVLAHGLRHEHEHEHEVVLPAIDARMGQVYYGLYRNPGESRAGAPTETPRAIIPPALAAPTNLAVGDATGIVGAGSAWDRYGPAMAEALSGSLAEWLPERHPEAVAVARLAAARGLAEAVSPLELRAAYIRDHVAETPRP